MPQEARSAQHERPYTPVEDRLNQAVQRGIEGRCAMIKTQLAAALVQ